ncbi:MAG TPA: hypothetical protein VED85_00115, partial [Burkholderiaceae bacterium]|nr:hypothetical protein [Burkholderiaceae bacterium]
MRIGPVFASRWGAAILAGAALLLVAAAALGAGQGPGTLGVGQGPGSRSAGVDTSKATEEPVTLNFVNADVEAVIRA